MRKIVRTLWWRAGCSGCCWVATCDQDPQYLRFTYGPRGKPALATDMGAVSLRFNVSHSHGLALYAMTRGRELGVDVERIRPEIVQEQVAERFFSPREVTTLRALPVPLQATAFFACWTRKEAYIKATGEGLALPLDQFDVSLAPGEPAALLRTAWDPQEAPRWTMQDLDPAPGYRAAVAVAGHDWRLTCWDGPGAYLDVSNSPHERGNCLLTCKTRCDSPRQTGRATSRAQHPASMRST